VNRLHVLCIISAVLLPNAVLAEKQTVVLDVKDMVCPVCSYRVKKSLEQVPGTDKVDVRLTSREAIVTYDDTKTSPDALAQASTKAGFPATVRSGSGK
jgi:periplasmic mercuric ion binding protein